MKKIFIVCMVLCVCTIQTKAQRKGRCYIGVGAGFTSFQDVKYSKVKYSGFSGILELGYEKQTEKSIWNIALTGIQSTETPKTHSATNAETVLGNIRIGYLRNIKENLYIGVTWDVVDYYSKDFEGLGNNSVYQIASSNLFASGRYRWENFSFGLDLGLVSFTNESTGFAFSLPQDVTKGGKYNYQDADLSDPFNLKYGFLNFINKQLNIRTSIECEISERLSVFYQWRMRRFSRVKNYPVTHGSNSFSLRYNFGG